MNVCVCVSVVGAGGVLGRDALFVCAAAALYV